MKTYIQSKQVQLYTETFGSQDNPAILLIIGAGAVCTLYPTDFCNELMESGFFVIRYDQRDYGRSTHFPTVSQDILKEVSETHSADALPYTMEDLVNDAIAILNHFNITSAHVMGYSMGGIIAQILTILHPQRVLTLTSMSVGPATRFVPLDPIPQKTWDVLLVNKTTGDFKKDLSGWLSSFKYLHGSYRMDENRAIAYIKDIYDFEPHVDVAWNHIAVQHSMSDYYEALKEIHTPTLIIHGSEDKLQLPSYGKKTAELIPNAVFVEITKAGHMFFNKEIWDRVKDYFLKNIKGQGTFISADITKE